MIALACVVGVLTVVLALTVIKVALMAEDIRDLRRDLDGSDYDPTELRYPGEGWPGGRHGRWTR